MKGTDRTAGRHCGIAAAVLVLAFALLAWAASRFEARAMAAEMASASATVAGEKAPRIADLLKPSVKDRMLKEREAVVYASLGDADDSLKLYRFYAGMQVNAPLAATRKVLTDYELYARMIPYIDHAKYSPETRVLDIQGGVLGFVLKSQVRFQERGEGWIQYRIVGGHFQGLSGDILFEPAEARGTAVVMRGEKLGTHWPPKFIIERGAEIVFGFTARRMRSYIESESHKAPAQGGAKHGSPEEIPQPRSRL